VTGEHVGEESNGEREGPDEERRDELDRRHEDVQRLGHARREQRALPVAEEALVLEAGADEHHPHEQRQEHRDGDARRGRHVDDRDDAGDVAQVDEHEDRQEERRPAEAVLAHRLHDDAVLDELDRWLVYKGSVAIDGISLTVATLDSGVLGITIIPHTFEMTSLRGYTPGARVNIECDILAKHVDKLMALRSATAV